MSKFEVGKKVFFVKNNSCVSDGIVMKSAGGFYTVKIGSGAIRLRESRLFGTEQEAMEVLKKYGNCREKRIRSLYDYDH